MAQKEIRVGIVGANTQKGWANVSHVPAINGLPGLRLAAVATRNEQSARGAAEAFSVKAGLPMIHLAEKRATRGRGSGFLKAGRATRLVGTLFDVVYTNWTPLGSI